MSSPHSDQSPRPGIDDGVHAAVDVVVDGYLAALQLDARLDAAVAQRLHVVELERQRVLERVEVRLVWAFRSAERSFRKYASSSQPRVYCSST